jgi:hypothetical protein
MHVPINVKSPNNISKWQMGFNLAFKGLISIPYVLPFLAIVTLPLFFFRALFFIQNGEHHEK